MTFNKNFFTTSFILYLSIIIPNIGIPSKGDLTHNKPVKKPLASCSLINLDVLLPQTTQDDESIILPFFIVTCFVFLRFYVPFVHFKQ